MKTATIRFLLVGLALATLVVGAAVAQQRLGSGGHRLDRNLGLNSGGYNRGVNQTTLLRRQGYSVGRDSSLYVIDSSGDMRYSRNNAFNTGRYQATGYTGQYSQAGRSMTSFRRFRY